jgi:hypothetical protein
MSATSSRIGYLLVAASLLSAATTLLVPDLLTGPAAMQGSARGTALVVALGGAPVLALGLRRARSGSVVALAVAAGAAAYLLYNAVMLVLATPFNRAFPLYEAMLGLAIWTCAGLVVEIFDRAGELRRPAPRWTAVFVGGVVVLNLGAWLSNLVPALVSEHPGSLLEGTGLTTNPVYVQDLAFWLPALAWAAVGMWRANSPRIVLGASVLCYWVLEAASVAADQWWGHRADPASSVVSAGAVPLFLVVGAVTIWPLLAVMSVLRDADRGARRDQHGVPLPMSGYAASTESDDTERQGAVGPSRRSTTMRRFIIEREVPGAGDLSQEELAHIARTSNEAVASLGVPYTWVNSYVAGDKIYCVHEAEDAEAIIEHARRGGFPANLVTEVANEFGPQSAELVAG